MGFGHSFHSLTHLQPQPNCATDFSHSTRAPGRQLPKSCVREPFQTVELIADCDCVTVQFWWWSSSCESGTGDVHDLMLEYQPWSRWKRRNSKKPGHGMFVSVWLLEVEVLLQCHIHLWRGASHLASSLCQDWVESKEFGYEHDI